MGAIYFSGGAEVDQGGLRAPFVPLDPPLIPKEKKIGPRKNCTAGASGVTPISAPCARASAGFWVGPLNGPMHGLSRWAPNASLSRDAEPEPIGADHFARSRSRPNNFLGAGEAKKGPAPGPKEFHLVSFT